jgi:recombination protein RecT
MASELAKSVEERGAAAQQGRNKTLDDYINQYADDFAAVLPANGGLDQAMFARLALNVLRYKPQLREVEPASFLGALFSCAQMGLDPTGLDGEIYMTPFNANAGTRENPRWVKRLQLIVGYQGYLRLAERTGKIRTLVGRPVYQNDEFLHRIVNGQDEVFHTPTPLGKDRGSLIGTYATAVLTDGSIVVRVCSVEEIESARKRSKAGGKEDPEGPWVTDFEAMAIKTAVRRLWKWIPKEEAGIAAFNADHRVFDRVPEKGQLMAPARVDDSEEITVLDAEEVTEEKAEEPS